MVSRTRPHAPGCVKTRFVAPAVACIQPKSVGYTQPQPQKTNCARCARRRHFAQSRRKERDKWWREAIISKDGLADTNVLGHFQMPKHSKEIFALSQFFFVTSAVSGRVVRVCAPCFAAFARIRRSRSALFLGTVPQVFFSSRMLPCFSFLPVGNAALPQVFGHCSRVFQIFRRLFPFSCGQFSSSGCFPVFPSGFSALG